MCDPATRGIWSDAVNVMLLQRVDSVAGTDEQLARLLRCRTTQLQAAVCELKLHDVAIVSEQNGIKTLTNRRLQKELRTSRLRSKAGASSKTKRDQTPEHTSVYASASASASIPEGGMQGGNGAVDLPRGFPKNEKEAMAHAGFIGCPAEFCATEWAKAMSRGGVDSRGQMIRSFRHHVQANWVYSQERKADKNGLARAMTPLDLKTIIQAKENEATAIRNKHCSDTAIDQIWNDKSKRKEFFDLKREIKTLNNQLSNMA